MIDLLNALLIILMFWVVLQDFKSRTLNLYVAISIFLISSIIALNTYAINWILEVIFYNFLLLVLFYGLLILFYLYRGVSLFDFFEGKLGVGDIVFTISIISCFTFKNLLYFLLLSFLFSLLIHKGLSFFKSIKSPTIPLAGNMALFLIIVKFSKTFGFNEPINSLI
ncbi:hypothetical protein [Nonlabens xylanidelens]|nr:hypothetical protein [Nonlabens xylanidelens]